MYCSSGYASWFILLESKKMTTIASSDHQAVRTLITNCLLDANRSSNEKSYLDSRTGLGSTERGEKRQFHAPTICTVSMNEEWNNAKMSNFI